MEVFIEVGRADTEVKISKISRTRRTSKGEEDEKDRGGPRRTRKSEKEREGLGRASKTKGTTRINTSLETFVIVYQYQTGNN